MAAKKKQVKFKHYKQDPRNGKVRVIKARKQELKEPYRSEFKEQMQFLRAIRREEF